MNELDPWRVTGLERFPHPERESRLSLARESVARLRSALAGETSDEAAAWAVDELTEAASCVADPALPEARAEMDSTLALVVEKLRDLARAPR